MKLLAYIFLPFLILLISCSQTGRMIVDFNPEYSYVLTDEGEWESKKTEDIEDKNEFKKIYPGIEKISIIGFDNSIEGPKLEFDYPPTFKASVGHQHPPLSPPTPSDKALGYNMSIFAGISGIAFLSGLGFIIFGRDVRVGGLLMICSVISGGIGVGLHHFSSFLATIPIWGWILITLAVAGMAFYAFGMKHGWSVHKKQAEKTKNAI